jgi:hypothetical protein
LQISGGDTKGAYGILLSEFVGKVQFENRGYWRILLRWILER